LLSLLTSVKWPIGITIFIHIETTFQPGKRQSRPHSMDGWAVMSFSVQTLLPIFFYFFFCVVDGDAYGFCVFLFNPNCFQLIHFIALDKHCTVVTFSSRFSLFISFFSLFSSIDNLIFIYIFFLCFLLVATHSYSTHWNIKFLLGYVVFAFNGFSFSCSMTLTFA
jgi:hypothetical protein